MDQKASSANEATNQLVFNDGPLNGRTATLTGVVPFMQFQIGGTNEKPVFHLYRLDEFQDVHKAAKGVVQYSFDRTFSFEEMAQFGPKK